MGFAFAIGDFIKPTGQSDDCVKYCVFERHSQECMGGTQLFYLCRPYVRSPLESYRRERERKWAIGHNAGGEARDYIRLRADEVEAWIEVPDPEPKP